MATKKKAPAAKAARRKNDADLTAGGVSPSGGSDLDGGGGRGGKGKSGRAVPSKKKK
jgi:hypothetical protein